MPLLLLLFIVIPIVEIWLLIKVGSVIGAISTVALVMLTAVIGLALLRQQGFSTLLRLNQRLAQGELPATEVFEGVVLAIGGALLLTPGFFTDAIGFLCLIPPTRRALIHYVLKHAKWRVVQGGGFNAPGAGGTQPQRERSHLDSSSGEHTTIDGEFRREDDNK